MGMQALREAGKPVLEQLPPPTELQAVFAASKLNVTRYGLVARSARAAGDVAPVVETAAAAAKSADGPSDVTVREEL